MTHTALVSLSALALASSAGAASLITNGSLDAWSGGAPDGWAARDDVGLVQVSDLGGGSGSAAQLTATSGTGVGPHLEPTLSGSAADQLYLQFDFQQLTTGTDKAGGRLMNLTLRNASTSLFNIRVNHNGTDNGLVEIYDGSTWQNLGLNQTELIDQASVYQLSLDFDLTVGTYDLEILNLSNSTSAASATGLNWFQSGGGTAAISEVRFERGRSVADWVVDNVTIDAVPEPTSAFLLAGSLLPLALKRRRSGAGE
ncbi:MAG: hypothetical protein ACQKBY_07580 [Verrucomicrobiales bacterium]